MTMMMIGSTAIEFLGASSKAKQDEARYLQNRIKVRRVIWKILITDRSISSSFANADILIRSRVYRDLAAPMARNGLSDPKVNN